MELQMVNFSVRLTANERADLTRVAASMERKPGDAVRVLLRQKLAEVEKAQNTRQKKGQGEA